MKTNLRQSGLTLMEMTVVIAAIALLAVFGLPAVRAMVESLASSGGTKAMIGAALSSARAIAAKEQKYAGIRFQNAYNPDVPGDPFKTSQYMVFIIHDPAATGLSNGFRAVEGIEPIKLPDSVGVMDLRCRINSDPSKPGDEPIDDGISEEKKLRDTTTFSIIFSPTGKLIIQEVRVRNKDGYSDTNTGTSDDDIFNKKARVDSGIGMFYQDDYTGLGLGQESSRNSFIIYDTLKLKQVDSGSRYTGYLKQLESSKIYINSYTGTIINK